MHVIRGSDNWDNVAVIHSIIIMHRIVQSIGIGHQLTPGARVISMNKFKPPY